MDTDNTGLIVVDRSAGPLSFFSEKVLKVPRG